MPTIDYKRLLKAISIVIGLILAAFLVAYIFGLMATYLTFEMFFWSVVAAFFLYVIVVVYGILGISKEIK